jgi:hypothetical protein
MQGLNIKKCFVLNMGVKGVNGLKIYGMISSIVEYKKIYI